MIPEQDWKILREVRTFALDRFCQRVLDEIAQTAADVKASNHERYLAIFKLLHERNEELADAFDDPRRSTALVQMARMRYRGVLTDDEFARFTPGTRESVQGLVNMWMEQDHRPRRKRKANRDEAD